MRPPKRRSDDGPRINAFVDVRCLCGQLHTFLRDKVVEGLGVGRWSARRCRRIHRSPTQRGVQTALHPLARGADGIEVVEPERNPAAQASPVGANGPPPVHETSPLGPLGVLAWGKGSK